MLSGLCAQACTEKSVLPRLPASLLCVPAQIKKIVDERMLVSINDLLASGEIPDLFAQVRDAVWAAAGVTASSLKGPAKRAPRPAQQDSTHSPPFHLGSVAAAAQEEREEIISGMRGETKSLGLQDTPDNCWATFIGKVRANLHVAFTASPVGEAFRVRSQVRRVGE